MTRSFIAISICIGAGLLAACSTSVRAPKAFFNKVVAAGSDRGEVVAAFNSSIVRFAGLTLSISGSYSPPIAAPQDDVPDRTAVYTFTYANKPAFSLHVRGPDSCFPTTSAEKQLGEALQSVLAGVKGLPAGGSVTVELSMAGPGIHRYAFSMRDDRSFALRYFVACRPGDEGQALMYAAMLGLHESTHASLSLRKSQSRDSQHRESVAIGGEACLFLNLEDRGMFRREAHQALSDRLTEAAGGNTHMSTQERCALWRATILDSHLH